MRTKKTVDQTAFVIRNGGTTHLTNSSLPMAYLKVKKSALKISPEGVITEAQKTASGFPKLEIEAVMADNITVKTNLVLYGGSIPGLLALECEETDTDLHFGAAYDHKSNKWISNTSVIDDLMTEPVAVGV